jgi:structural maintenance of chromosome 2
VLSPNPDVEQIGAQVETLKTTIAELKAAVQNAKDKQKAAKAECEKLEKDMDEFKNNKDGKIDELKVLFFPNLSERFA